MDSAQFFGLLCQTALVDGLLQDEERPILEDFAKHLGLSGPGALEILRDVKENKQQIKLPKDQTARRIVFLGVLAVIVADREVKPAEESLLRRVARRFEMDQGEVTRALEQALSGVGNKSHKAAIFELKKAGREPEEPDSAGGEALAVAPHAEPSAQEASAPSSGPAGEAPLELVEVETEAPRRHAPAAARPMPQRAAASRMNASAVRQVGVIVTILAGLNALSVFASLAQSLYFLSKEPAIGLVTFLTAAIAGLIVATALQAGISWWSVTDDTEQGLPEMLKGFEHLRFSFLIFIGFLIILVLGFLAWFFFVILPGLARH